MQIGIGLGIPATHGNIAGFTPLELSPTMWLDASDTSTITEVSGAVSQWDDKSGNGYHVVQATAANQPTTGTRTLNGLNVLDWNGDFMRPASWTLLAQPTTMLIVAAIDVTAVSRNLIDGSTNGQRQFIHNWTAGFFRMYAGAFLQGSASTTNPIIARAVFNSTSSVIAINGSAATGNAGTESLSAPTIGANLIDTETWDGLIAEVIIVDRALTASEIAAAEQHLADKWGITI